MSATTNLVSQAKKFLGGGMKPVYDLHSAPAELVTLALKNASGTVTLTGRFIDGRGQAIPVTIDGGTPQTIVALSVSTAITLINAVIALGAVTVTFALPPVGFVGNASAGLWVASTINPDTNAGVTADWAPTANDTVFASGAVKLGRVAG